MRWLHVCWRGHLVKGLKLVWNLTQDFSLKWTFSSTINELFFFFFFYFKNLCQTLECLHCQRLFLIDFGFLAKIVYKIDIIPLFGSWDLNRYKWSLIRLSNINHFDQSWKFSVKLKILLSNQPLHLN